MTAADQDRARRALAVVAQTLRPDWDAPTIHAVIEALHRDRYLLGTIARGTIDAACTPTLRTAAGIADRVQHPAQTPEPPAPATSRCRDCGMVVTRGESHSCGRVLDPPQTRDAAARARAALRGAVTP